MATRRPATLAVMAACALVLSVGVGASAAPNEAESENSKNKVECRPNGTVTTVGNTVTCTINTQEKNARCIESSNSPDATLKCDITQTGPGDHHAVVKQTIHQERTAPPFLGVCPPLRSLIGSNQNGCQIATVTQTTSGSGSNSLDLVQRIEQEIERGNHQFQNAGQDAKVNQCVGDRTGLTCVIQPSSTGKNLTNFNQSQQQQAEANVAATQFQRSTAHGSVVQNNKDVSKAFAHQKAQQELEAPAGSSQTQDPEDFCCTLQRNNPANIIEVDQNVKQRANGTAQGDDIFCNTLGTSGTGTCRQSVTTNQGTTTNSCGPTQGGCSAFIVCGGEGSPACTKGTGGEGILAPRAIAGGAGMIRASLTA